jgi:hypothetical protein
MNNPGSETFLKGAADDAEAINQNSDIVRIVPDPCSGAPPNTYHGLFWKIEHLERSRGGTLRVTDDPIPFTFFFPEDYLGDSDPRLPLRVVTIHKPIFHPNLSGTQVRLGKGFRPGTRLRVLLHQLYLILSSRRFATEHVLDNSARRYYLGHVAKIAMLRSPPLWRCPMAAEASVQQGAPPEAVGVGERAGPGAD